MQRRAYGCILYKIHHTRNTMNKTIHSIIFDIGQVLVDFNWKSYIEGLGFSKEVTQRLKEATVLSPLWNEQDRGDYDIKDLIELHTSKDREIKEEIEVFFDKIEEIVEERPYAPKLLKELQKAGYQVLLLSNYGKYAFQIARKKFNFLSYIDGGVISYEVGVIKPDKAIYQCLIDKYHLNPEECIFIDDKPENIEAAEEIGFHGIVFETIQQVLEEMKHEYNIFGDKDIRI